MKFHKWLLVRRLSDATVKNYLNQLRMFVRDVGNLEVKKIQKEDVINWILILKERGVKEGHVINCLWSMRAFLKFLKEEEKIDGWHFQDLKIPKGKSQSMLSIWRTVR